MSQAYRPYWDFCKAFKNQVPQAAENYGETSETPENQVDTPPPPPPPPPRVKTIAKAFRKELPKVKAAWKSFLPDLSTEDVRRYHFAHHEIVCLELEEAGYENAAQYLRMLFDLDEEMRVKAGPGTIIWTNPRIKDDGASIDRLKIGLAEANKAMLNEQPIAQAAALLDTALHFQGTSWEWWWVAEKLFRSAMAASEAVENDDHQTLTTIKYLYGRFLFKEMKETKVSLKFLDEARQASEDKSWNASKILGIKQDSVFRECCTLLYRAMLEMAIRAQRNHETDIAIAACQKALKHATDSDHEEYITDVLCVLGRSYLASDQPQLALQNFIKYLNLSRQIFDHNGICDAHMELAFTYKELGDPMNTMEHLERLRETASKFELPYKLAQAHYYIGEHLLTHGVLPAATSHLEFAFTLYNGLGQTLEANHARCIAAVSKGQEFIDQYIELILQSGEYDQAATVRLCDWKNNRVPFWRGKKYTCETYGESDDGEYQEFHQPLQRSENQIYWSASDYENSSHSEVVKVESLQSAVSVLSVDSVPHEASDEND
ncbi:uncharacterized protein LOC107222410 isoform X1 [Neodiprion lecontei]|uniref:Tetratricopeptide repeat protein 29 n=1 Tax=Neodiprion lecontei TaxID=441921 RepID=A0ABM3GGE8_NEOLC|nr:uncharacterized protein LOC107222410 isoform X1 [Neodiprion lecontei]XP_046599344.1 uncharacterized protein LOC107222410 isoform X1 [Neodiprion lecontei]XP_046599345.1 uncharacterized protein LOC107222410 isoform X1 [Neodiprion lecontei]